MKKLLLILLTCFPVFIQAQTDSVMVAYRKPHRIIMQLASDDPLVHKSLMKQLNNIITVSPESQVEVVCHGPGISLLLRKSTLVQDTIARLAKDGITFKACDFTLKERNIARDSLISEAGIVPYGILEIVSKQEEGWVYIKNGF